MLKNSNKITQNEQSITPHFKSLDTKRTMIYSVLEIYVLNWEMLKHAAGLMRSKSFPLDNCISNGNTNQGRIHGRGRTRRPPPLKLE
jgi:hypothetical protein